MKASMKALKIEKKKKPNLNLCMKCKQDSGNNFVLVYKKNNELKGKLCTACNKKLELSNEIAHAPLDGG